MAQGRSLESFAATGKASRGGTGGIAPAKVSLPPLYAHPKTGQTWSGRGPKPAWLYFVCFVVIFFVRSSCSSWLRGCLCFWVYLAVAGTPIATPLGAREARRVNAITDATSASAALP